MNRNKMSRVCRAAICANTIVLRPFLSYRRRATRAVEGKGGGNPYCYRSLVLRNIDIAMQESNATVGCSHS